MLAAFGFQKKWFRPGGGCCDLQCACSEKTATDALSGLLCWTLSVLLAPFSVKHAMLVSLTEESRANSSSWCHFHAHGFHC